jgi:hypothetical protein
MSIRDQLVLLVCLASFLGAGCQTFTMTEDEFAAQQRRWAKEPVTPGFVYQPEPDFPSLFRDW